MDGTNTWLPCLILALLIGVPTGAASAASDEDLKSIEPEISGPPAALVWDAVNKTQDQLPAWTGCEPHDVSNLVDCLLDSDQCQWGAYLHHVDPNPGGRLGVLIPIAHPKPDREGVRYWFIEANPKGCSAPGCAARDINWWYGYNPGAYGCG